MKNIKNELCELVTESLVPLTQSISYGINFGSDLIDNDDILIDTKSLDKGIFITPNDKMNVIIYDGGDGSIYDVSTNIMSCICVDHSDLQYRTTLRVDINGNVLMFSGVTYVRFDYTNFEHNNDDISPHHLLISIKCI